MKLHRFHEQFLRSGDTSNNEFYAQLILQHDLVRVRLIEGQDCIDGFDLLKGAFATYKDAVMYLAPYVTSETWSQLHMRQ